MPSLGDDSPLDKPSPLEKASKGLAAAVAGFRKLDEPPRIPSEMQQRLSELAAHKSREIDANIVAGELAKANRASEFCTRLVRWIEEFDKTLDNEHEVGVRLVSFGQTLIFRVENLGYHDPSLIIFHGHTDDGNPVTLIQHVSQISFLLMSVKRNNPEEPKKPIGFISPANSNQSDSPAK
jgi:hypothetical protein